MGGGRELCLASYLEEEFLFLKNEIFHFLIHFHNPCYSSVLIHVSSDVDEIVLTQYFH